MPMDGGGGAPRASKNYYTEFRGPSPKSSGGHLEWLLGASRNPVSNGPWGPLVKNGKNKK